MVGGVIWFLSRVAVWYHERVSGSERVSDIIQPQAIKPYHTHNHYVTCLLHAYLYSKKQTKEEIM